MINPAKLKRISWECVHFTPSIDLPSARNELGAQEIRLFDFEAIGIDNKERLLDAIASAMQFPDYFGRNWQALIDCLHDMRWSPANGYVLAIIAADQLWMHSPQLAGTLVEIWLSGAQYWSQYGKPFHLVFVV